jgi:DNA anti-recombination protein RmuC
MTLAAEDLAQIGEFIDERLRLRLAEPVMSNVRYELEIRERIVRVEEELRHQRDLMQQGFALMDKRFEEMQQNSNRRFEAMDKRFEEMQQNMNMRFAAVDKRFEEMQQNSNRRFEEMQQSMNMRFAAVDKRFDESNQRFTELMRRIDRFMFWSLGLTLAVVFLFMQRMA